MNQFIKIQLLGGFNIQGNIQLIVKSERLRAILTYLMLHRGIPQMRRSLAFQFWPDSTDAQARTNLRRELHTLRHHLSPLEPCLQINNKSVCWREDAPCLVDLFEFEAAIARAERAEQIQDLAIVQQALQRAADLYQGELYPSCYDDWITTERERLQSTGIRVLSWLIELLIQRQDYRKAALHNQKLLRLDTLNESAYLSLMKLYALQGDRAGGLRIYHRCMELLREELGIEPSPQLQITYEQLLMSDDVDIEAQAVNLNAQTTEFQGQCDQQSILSPPCPKIDWGEAIAVDNFSGRIQEQVTVTRWIVQENCRLVALMGRGGVGKTALAAKVCNDLFNGISGKGVKPESLEQQSEEASHPAKQPFERLIWRSLHHAPSLQELLADLIPFLEGKARTSQDIDLRPEHLLYLLRQSRSLIVLDGLEGLLQSRTSGHYKPECEEYSNLFHFLGETPHQSCVIVTSREKATDFSRVNGVEQAVRSLILQGSSEAAESIFMSKGIIGTSQQKQELIHFYAGNPLALRILASSIQDLFDGDLDAFLEHDSLLVRGVYRLYEQPYARCSPLEQKILTRIAIHGSSTSIDKLAHNLFPSVKRSALLEALESLRWRFLIEKKDQGFQLPIALRACLLERLHWTNDCIERLA